MRQIWIERKGGPDALRVREVPLPEPGTGQVRVRVAAAGVNFADVMMRRGLYPDAPKLPAVAGYEVAGEVDAAGPGVDISWEGRPVVAMCRFGGYSEYVCLPLAQVWPRPAGVDAVTAAAVPVNYLTAWQMIEIMAPPAPDETVLIHSAAGGVGQAVIQLCRRRGVRVVGSASPAKHARLREQGLDHVFDSQQTDFVATVRAATGGRGADVALEPRHGRWIMESYRSLAKCGRLVLFGFASAARGRRSGTWSALRTLAAAPWWQLHTLRLINDNRSLGGVNLGRMWDQHTRTGAWLEALLELLIAGEIVPQIDAVIPFAEAGRAHDRLESRVNFGKVILVPDA